MKKLLLSTFLMLTLFFTTHAQDSILKNNELGIDLMPILIWAGGGDSDYNAFEVIYREALKQGDLRFKININNRNFYGDELVRGKPLEDNKPTSFTSLQTVYMPKTSYLLSVGLSKYLANSKLPVYAGMDANLGISRGTTTTYIKETFLTEENLELIGNKHNNLTVLGLTPFIGVKKNLTNRIVFGIEFGLELNYVLGDLEYYDEHQELQKEAVSKLDFSWKKLINDFTLMIRI
ncbi:MAG: hypothetical protein DHS20C18_28370 [Saprospiraceae bacterium]|nr:MAG: hypothetical protein DHS20C18_28370 [Saprospiraceae bacterium]